MILKAGSSKESTIFEAFFPLLSPQVKFPPNLTVMAEGTGAPTHAAASVSLDGKAITAAISSAPVTVRTRVAA